MRHPEPKFDANAAPRIPCGRVLFLSPYSPKRVVPAVSRRTLSARGSCPGPLLSIAVVKRESDNLLAFAVDIPASTVVHIHFDVQLLMRNAMIIPRLLFTCKCGRCCLCFFNPMIIGRELLG